MRTVPLLALAAAAALLGGCTTIREVFEGPDDFFTGASARAELIDAEEQVVGRAAFEPTPNGMLIRVRFDGLPRGRHALHVHQTGKCETPDFESAGGHFNPFNRQHGFRNPAGAHAGDLPNIVVPESGELELEVLADELTLSEGSAALLDTDGAALMVHAASDDYRSDPAGNAGPRIACGVIRR